ncbi:P-loop containing nucleoside triphosphate hydrolase protein [Amylocystis lapponica]|nr:P-loop containing nucleoside triphosphate hydrolase protein [Amylocystis lapponica]
MSAATSARRSFQFSSPAGRALCRSILARHFPYAPHDYQLDGVCQALDGVDVLAVTPTGSGKTGFMTMYMVIARELACEPSLYPGPGTLPAAFKKNAMMLVVCPTKSLEMDMQPKFQAVGLSTLAINADTMEKARHEGRNLWEEACTPNIAALLLAPEQLKSKGFERLLANKDSASRIIAMGVDEVHLLVSWGAQFRPVFRQIGNVRLRLPGLAVLIGLTATLRPGPHVQAACGFLGLRPGAFHYIRRSNARHDIRLIFRDMQSGQRAMQFPELDWVLRDDRRIIIFCSTIALGFRVASYLWDQAAQLPDCAQRIRMYNALNWPSYNSDTLTFMQSDSRSRVTIATDTLAVGIDAAQTDDVVIYGDTPPDTDMLLQKIGRIRDGSSRRSRAFIYLPRTAADAAKKVLATPASNMPSKAVPKSSRKDTVQLDSSIARLIIAKCKVDEIDSLYGNNEAEVPLGVCRIWKHVTTNLRCRRPYRHYPVLTRKWNRWRDRCRGQRDRAQ